jgi:enolase-phosphatase E1
MKLSLSALNIRSILLDIEGTTTPISFVFDVLFPFARANVRDFLEVEFELPHVRADIAGLREEYAGDVSQNLSPPSLSSGTRNAEIESIVAYVHWLMDRDRKSTALKSLQGKIWQQGYRDKRLRSQVFPDVPRALERWHLAGLNVSIFSSGSVLAQKLLFSHTEAGDLTGFLDCYFDTTIGAKTLPESYQRIASALGFAPSKTLFVSDVVAELNASSSAGMSTVLCSRSGNPPQRSDEKQPAISSFNEITE